MSIWRKRIVRNCISACLALGLALAAGAARAAPDLPVRHVVQSGDTLSALAEQYGSTVPALVAANALPDPDLLPVGRVLIVPPASAPVLAVEVKPGDTLPAIAQRIGVQPALLRQLNGLEPGDHLLAGQDLLLPADPAQPSPALPPGPLTAIEVWPDPARQGETLLVRLRTAEPLSLTVRFEGQTPGLYPAAGDASWTLLAVYALAEPGPRFLDVSWQTASGDRGALRWPVRVGAGDYETFDIVLPPDKGDLLDPELVRAEAEKLAAIWGGPQGQPAWRGRFRQPIGQEFPTSAPFGQRRSYNGGPVNGFHGGQDFAAPEGTPVLAPAAGQVVLAEPLVVRGNAVVIDHGAGLFSGYWHLSSIAVSQGQAVQPGDLIGLVGTTGLSTGNHLHWEMRLHGIAVSPMQWLTRILP